MFYRITDQRGLKPPVTGYVEGTFFGQLPLVDTPVTIVSPSDPNQPTILRLNPSSRGGVEMIEGKATLTEDGVCLEPGQFVAVMDIQSRQGGIVEVVIQGINLNSTS